MAERSEAGWGRDRPAKTAPPGQIATEVAPLGGVKDSGLGRKGSEYGIEDDLDIKYLALGGIGT